MSVTITLIAVNVIVMLLVYAISLAKGVIPGLVIAFLASSPAVLFGELHRLITYMFVHGDVMHLLFNMYALLVLGSTLERYLRSSAAFLTIYFASGIVAGLSPLVHLFLLHSLVFSIGSSGAIFGLVGAIATMPIRRLILSPWNILALVLINVVGLFARVDVVGHALGLLTGVPLGYAAERLRRRRISRAHMVYV